MNIDSTWKSMLAQRPQARTTRRLSGAPDLGVVATVSGGANLAGVIIETGIRGGGPAFPNFRAIRMDYVEGSPDWSSGCILELRDASLMANFALMTNQILGAVDGVTDARARLDAVHACIRTWLRIFKREHSPLSGERQRGLFMELHVLNLHLRSALGDSSALSAWNGPDGSIHDFSRGNRALECKAHSTPEPHIHVHGTDQLDWKSAQPLWLLAAEVREEDDGRTLPELVDSIASSLVAAEKDGFTRKLNQAGYFDEHASIYQLPMEVGQVRCYKVQPGFPSLVDPPQGVTGVSYLLDLHHAFPFIVSEADVIRGFTA